MSADCAGSSEPEAPDAAYERCEMQDKVRGAIASLPPREQKVITLYYYGDVTMKQIGAEIGVNESRVSQLHARAIKRLRVVLADMAPAEAMSALKSAVLAFHQKPVMAKASCRSAAAAAHCPAAVAAKAPAVVVAIKPESRDALRGARVSRPQHGARGGSGRRDQRRQSPEHVWKSPARMSPGFFRFVHGRDFARGAEQIPEPKRLGQPAAAAFLEKLSASVPATSPVTKITRRATSGWDADSFW